MSARSVERASVGSIMCRKVAAILIAAFTILGGLAAPAQADTSPQVKLVSAEVLARGAAARLTFDVVCAITSTYVPPQLSVTLTQRQSRDGEGSAGVCGSHVSVLVLPEPGARPFKQGSAAVRAVLTECAYDGEGTPPPVCVTTSFSFTTELHKGEAIPPPPDSPIRIVSATLVSGGAAVRVVMTGTDAGGPSPDCDENSGVYYGVDAVISQRVGSTTTQSSARSTFEYPDYVLFDCASGTFRVTLLLPVQPGQKQFRAQKAIIQATLSACVFIYGCSEWKIESIRKLTKQPTT
jgi:hypothetical protein